jgi:hypothetical protein
MPIPITKVESVTSSDGYRLFDYSDALPALVFIPGMLLLIALWGAAVGPIWAILMVVLNGLASKTADLPLFGRGSGDSVFGFVLLVGLLVGAGGGALAGQAEPEPAEVAT